MTWAPPWAWVLRGAVLRAAAGFAWLALVLLALQWVAVYTFDPVAALLPADASAVEVRALREALGLDRPAVVRVAEALLRSLRGDFGESWRLRQPAWDLVRQHLDFTLRLAGVAAPVAFAGGPTLAVALAFVQVRGRLGGLGTLALAAQGVPGFAVAVLAVHLVAVQWRLAPASGPGTVWLAGLLLGSGMAVRTAVLLEQRLARLHQEPFVLAALARGVRPGEVYRRHLVRPALGLFLGYGSLQAGFLLSGSLVVETVFAYPGLGSLLVSAAVSRDVPVLTCGVAAVGTTFVVVRTVADALQRLADPRMHDRWALP
jgi:ABC-type dipeptide/oligopeptide/nickel transport system permease component